MFRRFALCILLAVVACSRREAVPKNPPIILISIDTLRADRLGRMPHLDALRKDSILFTHAYAHAPLTLPSHVSILTGLLPPDHGVRNNLGFTFDSQKHTTIPSLLAGSGYATGAAVSAYVLRGATGLGPAFQFYDDEMDMRAGEIVGRVQRPGPETEALAERWIAQHVQQPFFFMLHLFEPHTPYEPTYDADVAAAGRIVGKFIEFLKRTELYDRALIIVLSDHGEGLGDHGEDEHGVFLYREAIQVPLLIKLPMSERANETIDEPAQLVDILPTIAAIAGIQPPGDLPGRSLFDIARRPPRRIYSETLYPRIHLGWSDLRSLIDNQFHFIDAPRPELYAVSDVAERNNLIAEQRRVAAAMRGDLEPFSREIPTADNIDPEEAKKLAALGYLTATAAQASGPLPDPKDRLEELAVMKSASDLEKRGEVDAAIARYRDLIQRNPRLNDARVLMARLLEKRGRLGEAAETYRHAIQMAPAMAIELALPLANVYLMLNRFDEAADHARLGLRSDPAKAHIIIGRAALAKGDLATAEAEAEAARSGDRAAGLILRAQVLTKQRRLDEALAAIDQARALRSDVPLLHFVRGDILARMNRIDEAMAAFEEEIRLHPQDRDAYTSLAVLHILRGNRAAANAVMERLVAANPDRAAYELAARTFAQMGDEESARRWRRR